MKRFMESLKGTVITVLIVVVFGGLLWGVNFLSSLISVKGILDWFLQAWPQELALILILLAGQLLRDVWFKIREEDDDDEYEYEERTTRNRRRKEED